MLRTIDIAKIMRTTPIHGCLLLLLITAQIVANFGMLNGGQNEITSNQLVQYVSVCHLLSLLVV